jgi:hypothetical protein
MSMDWDSHWTVVTSSGKIALPPGKDNSKVAKAIRPSCWKLVRITTCYFGTLPLDFLVLWDPSQIRNAVLTCIIVHNMMVRYRQSLLDGSKEDYVHYAISKSVQNKLRVELRPEEEAQEVLEEFGLDEDPTSIFQDAVIGAREKTPEELRVEELFVEEVMLKRVTTLRNRLEHFRLRNAIVREVARQRKLWSRKKFNN